MKDYNRIYKKYSKFIADDEELGIHPLYCKCGSGYKCGHIHTGKRLKDSERIVRMFKFKSPIKSAL